MEVLLMQFGEVDGKLSFPDAPKAVEDEYLAFDNRTGKKGYLQDRQIAVSWGKLGDYMNLVVEVGSYNKVIFIP